MISSGQFAGTYWRSDRMYICFVLYPEYLGAFYSDNTNGLYIVDDKLGTPTYTHDFVNNLKLLLEKELFSQVELVQDCSQ